MTEMKLIVYISVQVHVHLNYVTCEIKIWMLAEICHFKTSSWVFTVFILFKLVQD